MAKCIGSVNKWTPKEIQLDDTSFLLEDVRQGERLLKQRVETTAQLLLDIANHFVMIKSSALDGDFKIDCSQVQDGLVGRLERLLNEATSVVGCISNSKLISSTKHRYFIQFTYGLIERLEQLVQTVGRLGDVDQRIYMEEQRNLLVSDESIVLHTLTSIWTAIIALLESFCSSAQPVFNPNPDEPNEYDFLEQLEFSTARDSFCKALIMDLIITSWIKFNRLVRYDDLVKSHPFLCQCQMQTFLNVISSLTKDTESKDCYASDDNLLVDMLQCILDYKCKPSMMTISLNRFAILPLEPCYAQSSQPELAYFVVWYLYSMARIARSIAVKRLVIKCQAIFDDSCKTAKVPFETNNGPLSPHQKERLQLLEYMIKSWEAFIFQNSPTSAQEKTTTG
jgi:hypothetical protein